ncbi:MAG: hypothetical protein BYD32DRAFT_405355 [Podila humilis]|nr:MAG: hypothetical protein BYD32DRAFT_405354 [Podila humilis]KAI9241704.1 MAG: hypothetical protein BYD32DRAFT_405355 [Podila humilis]
MVRITFLSFVASALVLAQAAYALPNKKILGIMHIGQGRRLMAPETQNIGSRVIFGSGGDDLLQMWEIESAEGLWDSESLVYIKNVESEFYLSPVNPKNPKLNHQLVLSDKKYTWTVIKGIVKNSYRLVAAQSSGNLVMDYTSDNGQFVVTLGFKNNRLQQQSWTFSRPNDNIFNEYCRSSSLLLQ